MERRSEIPADATEFTTPNVLLRAPSIRPLDPLENLDSADPRIPDHTDTCCPD